MSALKQDTLKKHWFFFIKFYIIWKRQWGQPRHLNIQQTNEHLKKYFPNYKKEELSNYNAIYSKMHFRNQTS
jgi:hypothetical protein